MLYPPPDEMAKRRARPNRSGTARTTAPNFPPGGGRPRQNHAWAMPFVAPGSGDALQHTQTLQPSSEPMFPDTYPTQRNGVPTVNHLGYGDETSTSSAAQNVADNGSTENGTGLSHMQMLVQHLEMQNEEARERIVELEKMVRPIRALLIKMDFLWERHFGDEGAVDGRTA